MVEARPGVPVGKGRVAPLSRHARNRQRRLCAWCLPRRNGAAISPFGSTRPDAGRRAQIGAEPNCFQVGEETSAPGFHSDPRRRSWGRTTAPARRLAGHSRWRRSTALPRLPFAWPRRAGPPLRLVLRRVRVPVRGGLVPLRKSLTLISKAIGTFGIVGRFSDCHASVPFQFHGRELPRLLDPRGTYLPDDDAARRHAEQLMRGLQVQGLNWSIEVISENGDLVDIVRPPLKIITL